MLTKTNVRHQVRQNLHKMSMDDRERLSESLLEQLEKDEIFRKAHIVLLYYSLSDEVNTHTFIRKWSKCKKILLPVVQGLDIELRTYQTDAFLVSSAFHIQVPQGPTFTDFSQIDLIIVPGVAFTSQGYRLGRGGGYYDRFLSKPSICPIPRIGICFPCQLLRELPVEPHDIAMDRVIANPFNEAK